MPIEQYYDTNINDVQTSLELRERGLNLDQSFLESVGIYPCEMDMPDADSRLYCVEPTERWFNPVTRTYHQHYEISEKPDFAARRLAAAKEDGRATFVAAFAALDARRSRPAFAVAEALALGQTPNQNDLDTLRRLNAVAEANRLRLAELEAAATLEAVASVEPLTDLDGQPESGDSASIESEE